MMCNYVITFLIFSLVGIPMFGSVCYGDIWADPTYGNRTNITFSYPQMSSNQSNIVLPIFLTGRGGFQSTCNDIQFYSSSAGAIDHYLDRSSCNNNIPYFYVRVGLNTVTNNTWMYFNNSAVTSDNSSHTTFDDNYTLVLPFNESVGPGGIIRDLSKYGNNGTVNVNSATFYNSSLVLGQALQINGTGSVIKGANVTVTTSMYANLSFTAEVWFRWKYGTTNANIYSIAGARPDSPSSARTWEFTMITNSGDCPGASSSSGRAKAVLFNVAGNPFGSCGSTAIPMDGTLLYLALVYNGTHIVQYLGMGSSFKVDATTAYSAQMVNSTGQIVAIGRESVGSIGFDNGNVIEELRLSNTNRSADFIAANYWAVQNRTTFFTFGVNETQPTAPAYCYNTLTGSGWRAFAIPIGCALTAALGGLAL